MNQACNAINRGSLEIVEIFEIFEIFFFSFLKNTFFLSGQNNIQNIIKGNVSVIKVTLHTEMSMPDTQRYSENLYLLNKKEDNAVFPVLNVIKSDNFSMFFCNENTQVTKNPRIWKYSFFPNIYENLLNTKSF